MDLQDRAARQFEKHDALRVLFFFDPDEKRRDEIADWDSDAIRLVTFDGTPFRLKMQLEQEWAGEKVLLYVPEGRPSSWEGHPLADLWFANRELQIDDVAERLEELGLSKAHRPLMQRYYDGELEHKNRAEFLGKVLTEERFTEENLQRGLAAYYAQRMFKGVNFRSVPQEELLVAALLIGATDPDAFGEYAAQCQELEVNERLARLVGRQFELGIPELSVETMREAARVATYNLLMRHIETPDPDDPYRKLRLESQVLRSDIARLARSWEDHGALEPSPAETLGVLTPNFDEGRLVEVYGADAEYGYLTPTLRRYRLQEGARHLQERPSQAKRAVGDLRGSSDLRGSGEAESPAAEALWQMGTFYQVLRGQPSLDFGRPAAFVETYVEELYRCDTAYRRAAQAMRSARRKHAGRADIVQDAYDTFLKDYHHEYLHPLNTAWQQALEERVRSGKPLEMSKARRQGDFYARYLGEDQPKTAVIVSDAFRYEIAHELMRRLAEDPRKDLELTPALAALPSVTAVGMAHLLPHETIASCGDGTFEIEGRSTEGTSNRQQLLQRATPDATALSFDKAMRMSSEDGRELFKTHSVTYVYHNRIDATGDQRATETDVIPAIQTAIEEVEQLVRRLNNWNYVRVLLTADHGFLYSDAPVPDAMQESFPDARAPVLKKNRVLLAEEGAGSSGYRFPLRAVSDIDADLDVIVPRAVNRYHQRGAGKQYAHGGASLQEMLVPTLEIRKRKKDTAEKVGVRLLTEERTIRASGVRIELLQAEAVSPGYQPRAVHIALYDRNDDTVISNEETLRLDAEAQRASDRTQSVMLDLKPEANDVNLCRLRVYDTEDTGRLDPLIDEGFTIKRLIDSDF